MTYINQKKQSTGLKEVGLIAGSSREELPFIQQGNNQLIDARIIHQLLKVGKDYSTWLKGRIQEYGFKPNVDFFSTIAPQTWGGKRGGHNRIDTLVTINMAAELCLVERNEEGHKWRHYFIEAEKKLRGIVSHAVTAGAPVTLEENAGQSVNGMPFVVPLGKMSTHSVYLNDVCYTKFAPLMKYLGYESESGSSWHVKLKEGIMKMDNTWYINSRGFDLMLLKITRMPEIGKVDNIRRDCFGRKSDGAVRYCFSLEQMMAIIDELNRTPIRRTVITRMLIGEKGGRHE